MKKGIRWTWFKSLGDYMFHEEELERKERKLSEREKTLRRRSERKTKGDSADMKTERKERTATRKGKRKD